MPDNPTALDLADTATRAWRAAATLQSAAVPDHNDFYDLAGELVGTLWALGQLVDTLHGQVARYGEGRVLRDDEGTSPSLRISEAAAHLHILAADLRATEVRANNFWSAIGHIGVVEEGT